MTAAAAPNAPGGSKGSGPDLHHRVTDALLGYGVLYLISIPFVLWLAARYELSSWPMWFATTVALLISVPHYGATYLRVYEKRHDRRRYAVFAIWITLALIACFVASLYSVRLGSAFLTIYVYWSPWHFAGQNFGVAMMSLRRKEVPIDPVGRRLLYGAFLLGYSLSVLALSRLGSSYQAVVGTGDGRVYEFYRLGIPEGVATTLLWILAPAYFLVIVGAIGRLSRGGYLRATVPAITLLITHSFWYALPAVLTEQIPLLYAGVWVSAIHSLQYLWITSYYAKQTDGARIPAFILKCLLVGSAINVLPALLFAPGLLGPLAPLALQAGVVSFSILNIHHFILDGAVWKLRDGRVARALLGTNGDESTTDDAPQGRSWVRPTLYVIGTLALLMPIYVTIEVARAASSQSREIVESASERLAFFGNDHADVYFVLGQHRAIEDDYAGAETAYRKALGIEPSHYGVTYRLAGLLLRDHDGRDEALELAQRAAQQSKYSDPASMLVLGRANLATGNVDSAKSAIQIAVKLAVQQGDNELMRIGNNLLSVLKR